MSIACNWFQLPRRRPLIIIIDYKREGTRGSVNTRGPQQSEGRSVGQPTSPTSTAAQSVRPFIRLSVPWSVCLCLHVQRSCVRGRYDRSLLWGRSLFLSYVCHHLAFVRQFIQSSLIYVIYLLTPATSTITSHLGSSTSIPISSTHLPYCYSCIIDLLLRLQTCQAVVQVTSCSHIMAFANK